MNEGHREFFVTIDKAQSALFIKLLRQLSDSGSLKVHDWHFTIHDRVDEKFLRDISELI